MAAKKKARKPKKPAAQKRTAAVMVRFTPAERDRIAKQADAEGLSPGVWIRRIVLLTLGSN